MCIQIPGHPQKYGQGAGTLHAPESVARTCANLHVRIVLTVTEWWQPCNHEAHQCGAVQIDGDITYNGEPFSNFFPQRTSAYVDQASHYPLRISALYTASSLAYCEQT